MPSVNIREIDKTGSETFEYIENIVLTPALEIKRNKIDGTSLTLDAEYSSYSVFKSMLAQIFEGILDEGEESIPSDIDREEYLRLQSLKAMYYADQGFVIACNILQNGLPIQYYGAYPYEKQAEVLPPEPDPEESGEEPEPVVVYEFGIGKFQIGTDTVYKTDSAGKKIGIINKATGLYKYLDKGRFDIRFITVGPVDTSLEYISGTNDSSFEDLCATITTIAAARGDCYALLAHPDEVKNYQYSKNENGKTVRDVIATFNPSDSNYSIAVDTWINDEFADLFGSYVAERNEQGYTWTDAHNEKYGNYATIFTPNVYCTLANKDGITDSNTAKNANKNRSIPAYVQYLLAYKQSTISNPTWFAVAGATRGTSSTAIVATADYGDADIDILQTRKSEYKGHISSNAIYYLRGTGTTIWGNRTMHPLSEPFSGGPAQLVASDFLNIRSMATDLKKTIYRSCRRHTFDPNSDNLWFAFKSEITPILEKMKSEQGCRAYRIIRVTTNKKAILAARIQVNPIEGVEDFDVTIEFTDTVEAE